MLYSTIIVSMATNTTMRSIRAKTPLLRTSLVSPAALYNGDNLLLSEGDVYAPEQ